MGSSPGVQIGPALTRLALAGLFASVPRLFMRIEAHGLNLDAGAPRTIYAITHKRDPDTFASPPVILAHRGWRALTADVRFIMRADAFQTGFLVRLVQRPDWLRRALRPFSVGGVLREAGVYPLDGFHSRPAELWIREAIAAEGDLPAGALLAPETLRAVGNAAGLPVEELAAAPISALSDWRYAVALQHPTGPGLFTRLERRSAERRMVEIARSELRVMADWLRAGGSLYMAPEGRLSPNGLLSPTRAGLRLITHDAPPDTRIQPIVIMYDFMTTGRQRMILDLAPPIENAAQLTGSQLDHQLRDAWLDAARFTCTQLATAALVTLHARSGRGKPATGRVDELAALTHSLAVALDAAGRHVDDALLTVERARWRVERYLRFAERHRLATRRGETYTFIPSALPSIDDAPASLPGILPDGVGYGAYPLRYAWNEAFEMLTAAGLLPATEYAALATATPYMAGMDSGDAGMMGVAEGS